MPSQSLGKLEKEELLHTFREIDKSPTVTQRGLSASFGISLDHVNFHVNVLIRKGFVKAANFKKSNNDDLVKSRHTGENRCPAFL